MRPRMWRDGQGSPGWRHRAMLSARAKAWSQELLGQAGVLGEWELTGNLTEGGQSMEFSGPLKMKHVGICTQDGPEERAGEISLQLASRSDR